MKTYEKTLLLLVIVAFVLLLCPRFSGQLVIYLLLNTLLALSYGIGGYKLFNVEEPKQRLLPITAGIGLCLCILPLPLLLVVHQETIFLFFPLVNLVMCLVLTLYILTKPKEGVIGHTLKWIYCRAIVFLIISAFFTYMPFSSRPFRSILIALNNGNPRVANNIMAHNFLEDSEAAEEKGECEAAIALALKGYESCKIWMDVTEDMVQEEITKRERFEHLLDDSIFLRLPQGGNVHRLDNWNGWDSIGGVFSALYGAYACRAEQMYAAGQYMAALQDYQRAHRYLITCNPRYQYWQKEKSFSLMNIALCYNKLNNFDKADSLIILATERYKRVNPELGLGIATLYSKYAGVLTDRVDLVFSNRMYEASNKLIGKDSVKQSGKVLLAENCNKLTINYFALDSIRKAFYFINRAYSYTQKGEEEYANTNLYHAIFLYKLNKYWEADSVLQSCLPNELGWSEDHQNRAERDILKGQINVALAKYDTAEKYIQRGMKLTVKNYGPESYKYANKVVVMAGLDKLLSNYMASEEKHEWALGIYGQTFSSRNRKMLSLYASFAELEVSLSKFAEAKRYVDSAMNIIKENDAVIDVFGSEDLAAIAYVNYALGAYQQATVLYNRVLKIEEKHARKESAAIAIAWNGLGLNETALRHYKAANEFFMKSLDLHRKVFSEKNPLTARVYLNFALLSLLQNKLTLSEEQLQQAYTILKESMKPDHDLFGDIFVAFGDLARKKGNCVAARNQYQKALTIYNKKFSANHWKVLDTQQKLSN